MSRLRRLDHALGRLLYRTLGVGTATLALFSVSGVWSAAEGGAWGTAALIAATGVALAGATAYCFSPKRRLSQIED